MTVDVMGKLFALFQDCNNPSWRWFPNNAEMMKLIDYLIAHGVTVQEWISVKDGLPKHNQRVLVYGTANIQMVAIYDAISKGRHWLICGTWYVEMTQEVTHWMPLPHPPDSAS